MYRVARQVAASAAARASSHARALATTPPPLIPPDLTSDHRKPNPAVPASTNDPAPPTATTENAAELDAAEPAADATPAPPQSLPRRIYTELYNFFSKEERLKKRKAIQEEYHTSYWKDLKELNQTKGKLFIAASELATPQFSPAFPPFTVSPLNDMKNPIDLRDHINKRASLPYIRQNVPADQRGDYFLSIFRDVERPLDMLRVTNRYLGWVFLVDPSGRVRWRAHGNATDEEREALRNVTGALLEEVEAAATKVQKQVQPGGKRGGKRTAA
ncbi:hypothetical protein AMAG_05782 [Allomyces macrogynus ATCC 38327]|uniref:Uncharacterized protein n=1 Tax=Allomyces macrogynus (strain ATCC 38327) TaxID=578462 RepID=A0A0L0SD66_ALLM3|nr:hypothetical protein AMAG_05782 [Allomyces macrogynus ATCC 38327]|eukprot:KNE60392.1 hypothetical protein AMAG_05782 [Allomyces macrogynus ATCC 38327]